MYHLYNNLLLNINILKYIWVKFKNMRGSAFKKMFIRSDTETEDLIQL